MTPTKTDIQLEKSYYSPKTPPTISPLLQRAAPNALHAYCAMERQKPPSVSVSCFRKEVTGGSPITLYDCCYSCKNRDGDFVKATARNSNKARARYVAACRLLSVLYPEHENVEQIMRLLDERLKQSGLNLRRIVPDEEQLELQQQNINLANEKLFKEGFNPTPTKKFGNVSSDSSSCLADTPPETSEDVERKVSPSSSSSESTTTEEKKQLPSNDDEFLTSQSDFFNQACALWFQELNEQFGIPTEEPIILLNEVIQLLDYPFPTCQHKENCQVSPPIQKVTMILEIPKGKGVYFSEGEGIDVRQAKSECSWKMLYHLFPHHNGNWFSIKSEIETMRANKRREKLLERQKKDETAVRRKLEFPFSPPLHTKEVLNTPMTTPTKELKESAPMEPRQSMFLPTVIHPSTMMTQPAMNYPIYHQQPLLFAGQPVNPQTCYVPFLPNVTPNLTQGGATQNTPPRQPYGFVQFSPPRMLIPSNNPIANTGFYPQLWFGSMPSHHHVNNRTE